MASHNTIGWRVLRLAFSAWLAFAIAAALHAENAYWAAMPVWVIVQPTRGLLLERGLFRLLGTLAGAAAGFALLRATSDAVLIFACLGIWIALCGGLVHLLRGAHSYGVLLAGMTAAVVVLPAVIEPERALPLALARVECTLIGVMVVTLVVGLFTPETAREDFYHRVRRLAGDAVEFAVSALASGGVADTERTRQILAELSDVDAAGRLVAADSREGRRRIRHVDELIGASLAVMAISKTVGARVARGDAPAPDTLIKQLKVLADRLRSAGPVPERLQLFQHASDHHDPEAQLARAANAIVAAEQALLAQPESADARSFAAKAVYLAPHRDWHRAIRIGAGAGLAGFLAGVLGWWTQVPHADLAALGVCIFCLVLGSLANPAAVAPKLVVGVLTGVAVAIVYRLTVQPLVVGWWSLVVPIAPFLLAGAIARVFPKTAIPAIDANMCFLLASQAGRGPAPLPEILSSAAALAGAAILVGGGFWLMPVAGLDGVVRRSVDRIRFDLRDLLSSRTDARERLGRINRHLLRLAFDLRHAEGAAEWPQGVLAAHNLGQAIAALRAAAPLALSPSSAEAGRALEILDGFDREPKQTERKLLFEADAASPDVGVQIRDAAHALQQLEAALASNSQSFGSFKGSGTAGPG